MTASQNYFELFDLNVHFDIDIDMLSEKYRDLQKAVHPDRFVNASEQTRLLSVQKAANINDAFLTLKSPLKRAKYMLSLRGIKLDDENNTAMDPAFLMEQMELREALAEVRGSADPIEAIEKLIDTIEEKIKSIVAKLKVGFEEPGSHSDSELSEQIRKFQFFEKLREDAEAIDASLEE